MNEVLYIVVGLLAGFAISYLLRKEQYDLMKKIDERDNDKGLNLSSSPFGSYRLGQQAEPRNVRSTSFRDMERPIRDEWNTPPLFNLSYDEAVNEFDDDDEDDIVFNSRYPSFLFNGDRAKGSYVPMKYAPSTWESIQKDYKEQSKTPPFVNQNGEDQEKPLMSYDEMVSKLSTLSNQHIERAWDMKRDFTKNNSSIEDLLKKEALNEINSIVNDNGE